MSDKITRQLTLMRARAVTSELSDGADRHIQALLAGDVLRLLMWYEASQAALTDCMASNTANAETAEALASVVTRQRSEIDTLGAELARLRGEP